MVCIRKVVCYEMHGKIYQKKQDAVKIADDNVTKIIQQIFDKHNIFIVGFNGFVKEVLANRKEIAELLGQLSEHMQEEREREEINEIEDKIAELITKLYLKNDLPMSHFIRFMEDFFKNRQYLEEQLELNIFE